MDDNGIRHLVKELFNAEIKALRNELVARLDGNDKAMTLYRAEMDKNMEHLNKVRGEVLLDRGSFVTIEYFRSEIDKLHAQAKHAWFSIIGWLLAIIGPIVVAFITWAVFRR